MTFLHFTRGPSHVLRPHTTDPDLLDTTMRTELGPDRFALVTYTEGDLNICFSDIGKLPAFQIEKSCLCSRETGPYKKYSERKSLDHLTKGASCFSVANQMLLGSSQAEQKGKSSHTLATDKTYSS